MLGGSWESRGGSEGRAHLLPLTHSSLQTARGAGTVGWRRDRGSQAGAAGRDAARRARGPGKWGKREELVACCCRPPPFRTRSRALTVQSAPGWTCGSAGGLLAALNCSVLVEALRGERFKDLRRVDDEGVSDPGRLGLGRAPLPGGAGRPEKTVGGVGSCCLAHLCAGACARQCCLRVLVARTCSHHGKGLPRSAGAAAAAACRRQVPQTVELAAIWGRRLCHFAQAACSGSLGGCGGLQAPEITCPTPHALPRWARPPGCAPSHHAPPKAWRLHFRAPHEQYDLPQGRCRGDYRPAGRAGGKSSEGRGAAM